MESNKDSVDYKRKRAVRRKLWVEGTGIPTNSILDSAFGKAAAGEVSLRTDLEMEKCRKGITSAEEDAGMLPRFAATQ
jgi:hypothetical protein